jgi:hypothetical protein
MSITRLCSSIDSVGDSPSCRRNQAVRALLDLPGHELLESLLVDRAAFEGGDQCTSDPANMVSSRISAICHNKPGPAALAGEQLAIVMPR